MLGCRAGLDHYVKTMKNRGGMKQEHRLPLMVLGGLLITFSLLWNGWTVQSRVQ